MKLINSDCLTALKELEDNSVDSIVSDPPYGISFMGRKWDYDVPKVEVWKEALRVLKPGGHALIACGTRTQHRMAVNIEDAGFEIRDSVEFLYDANVPFQELCKTLSPDQQKLMVMALGNDSTVVYAYGSGFPKSLNIGKKVDQIQGNEREITGTKKGQGNIPNDRGNWGLKPNEDVIVDKGSSPYEGWGTALKPAHENWIMCRKPISESTVAQNVLKWGTGGINIDGCRVEAQKGDVFGGGGLNSPVNGFMGNTENTYKKGTGFRDDSAQGRFPANFILSYPENSYIIKESLTIEQKEKALKWIYENAKHTMPNMQGPTVPKTL